MKSQSLVGVSSLEEVDPNDFTGGAKGLSAALNKLPQLTLRKKSLDMHMNIATNLFKVIQERQLDAFFSLEETIGKMVQFRKNKLIRQNQAYWK
jgi:hypothetical protein